MVEPRTHLLSRQEYVDRYDRITIEVCRRREGFHRDYKPSGDVAKGAPDGLHQMVSEVALIFDLLYTTLHWWENKEQTIREWMDHDTRKDELLARAHAPEDIRCLKCRAFVVPNDKQIYDWGDDKRERVLFMYDCPNGCVPHRAFFDDGEEYRPKPKLCPTCHSELNSTSERIDDKKIVTTDTCSKCDYIDTDEFDLTVKVEVPDPDYEKDRARFCLTNEQAKKKQEEKWAAENMGRLVDKWKEEEKRKDEYDAVAKIKQLTVVDLDKLLVPLLEKRGYVKLQLGTPEIGRDVFLPFTAQDSKSDRKDMASSYDLSRIIRKALADTNWRLMSDGISYRVGILSGRLRAYEKEEDLLELVKIAKKKEDKKQ